VSHISFKNVDLDFRAPGGRLRVLEQITFDIEDCGFTCLLGPSGAGKSVSLNLIGGLLAPTSGEVLVDGRPATDRLARYGYVFQQPRLLPWRTVGDNIRFALRAIGVQERREQDRRIDSVLDLVGLEQYVLLMDEPFSSLDEITSRGLREALVETWLRSRRTVVFVTHDISEASFLADRIILYTVKPSRVAAELTILAPRPRVYGSEELYRAERDVLYAFEQSRAELPATAGVS
jgi:ABC-type nitrate/sulfonate/bicarbonate transport system ATPase subunit